MKRLTERGAFCFKVHGSPQMMAGLPDIIASYQGKFIGIEVKTPTGSPSARQEYVGSLIKQSKGIWVIARDDESIDRLLDAMDGWDNDAK